MEKIIAGIGCALAGFGFIGQLILGGMLWACWVGMALMLFGMNFMEQ